jgi:EVE domain
MPKNWIAVASAEHAGRGRDEMSPGFMQVGHGRLAPLKRVHAGDRVAYYAPTERFGAQDKFQSFVSIGLVQAGEPYQIDMGGFMPYRRDVVYLPAHEAPITPLLDHFEFVEDRNRWGYKFRFGLFNVSDADMRLIAGAMQADLHALFL